MFFSCSISDLISLRREPATIARNLNLPPIINFISRVFLVIQYFFKYWSKIFIISETFTKRLLAFKEKGGKPYPIIEDLYKAYPEPDMKIIIDALGTTLRKRAQK